MTGKTGSRYTWLATSQVGNYCIIPFLLSRNRCEIETSLLDLMIQSLALCEHEFQPMRQHAVSHVSRQIARVLELELVAAAHFLFEDEQDKIVFCLQQQASPLVNNGFLLSSSSIGVIARLLDKHFAVIAQNLFDTLQNLKHVAARELERELSYGHVMLVHTDLIINMRRHRMCGFNRGDQRSIAWLGSSQHAEEALQHQAIAHDALHWLNEQRRERKLGVMAVRVADKLLEAPIVLSQDLNRVNRLREESAIASKRRGSTLQSIALVSNDECV